MDGLKPINVNKSLLKTSISSLETLQLRLDRKIAGAIKAPKALLEKTAKSAYENILPFTKDVSTSLANSSKIAGFASSIFNN